MHALGCQADQHLLLALDSFAASAHAFSAAFVQASEFLFGTNSLSYPTLLFPILSLGFLSAATVNSVQAVSWLCNCECACQPLTMREAAAVCLQKCTSS